MMHDLVESPDSSDPVIMTDPASRTGAGIQGYCGPLDPDLRRGDDLEDLFVGSL